MPEYNRKKKSTDIDTILSMNLPPQAHDVEEAVLGALLICPDRVEECFDELVPASFHDPKCRLIFEAMATLHNQCIPIDLISVAERLRQDGNLDAAGGSTSLADLSQNIGAAAHIEYYIKILRQKEVQRNIITASYDTIREALDYRVLVDDLVDNAYARLDSATRTDNREFEHIGIALDRAAGTLKERQDTMGPTGIPSGFDTIDKITLGWQKSDLIVIASRPSVGKTALALNLTLNAALYHNVPVAFFSMQMPTERLAERLIISESGLTADKVRGAAPMHPFEQDAYQSTLALLKKADIYFDDTPSLNIKKFRSKARKLVRKKGVRMIVVDYLQLMTGTEKSQTSKYEEIGEVCKGLKALARELDIPVIALSQLSRIAVQRVSVYGEPQLSDLSDSGIIEQVADKVILIHRPEFTGMSEDPSDKGKAILIFAKSNDFATCKVELKFKSEQVKFVEPDQSLDIQAQRPYTSAASGR